jgi:hypothetical protein
MIAAYTIPSAKRFVIDFVAGHVVPLLIGFPSRWHGAPADEARAGVDIRKRQREGSAAGGHPNFLRDHPLAVVLSGAAYGPPPTNT